MASAPGTAPLSDVGPFVRDQLCRIDAKLDRILEARETDAREHGELAEKVNQIEITQGRQAGDLSRLRERQNAPARGALRFALDTLKLLIAGGFGWLLSRMHT